MATNTARQAKAGSKAHGEGRSWRSRSPTRSPATSSATTGNADTFTLETSDGREFTVKLTDTTYAELVRNLGEPYADATGQMRDMLVPGPLPVRLRRLLPGGRARHVSRPSTSSSSGAPGARLRLREAGLVGQADPAAGRLLPAGAVPRRRRSNWRKYRIDLDTDRQQGRRPPGDRHHLAARSTASPRPTYMTGEDRFLEAAETRRRVPPRAPAHSSTRGEDIVYWYHAIDDRASRTSRRSSPRSSATTTTPSRPTSRSTPWPARPRPTASPATQRIRDGHRPDDLSLFERYFHDPDRRRLLLAHRPDHVRRPRASRWAATGRARTGTRSATTPRPT